MTDKERILGVDYADDVEGAYQRGEIGDTPRLVLRMYWDGEETPSVVSPIGDLFGLGHAAPAYFSSLPLQASYLGLNCCRIAFSSSRDRFWEIYVMNADGTGQTRLTDNPAYDADPSWSPDGNRIAFMSERDGHIQIYVMNADGTGQTNLSSNRYGDWNPSWSH